MLRVTRATLDSWIKKGFIQPSRIADIDGYFFQVDKVIGQELKAIIRDVLAEQTEPTATGVQSDNINLSRAIELLSELGYPTSKAKMHQLTSTGALPCRKYGDKLIFSRVELLK